MNNETNYKIVRQSITTGKIAEQSITNCNIKESFLSKEQLEKLIKELEILRLIK